MNAIGNFKNFKKEEIERLRIKKALKKGTFKKRIILKKVIQTTLGRNKEMWFLNERSN